MSMLPNHPRYWAPEHDAELRACMARGLSFREAGIALAKQFGIVRSRNACIGRAARIGLTSMLTPADGARKPRPSRRKGERVIVMSKKVVTFKPKSQPKPPTFQAQMLALRCVEVEPLHLSLLELEPGQCRYPFGDEAFTFCGHPQLGSRPYCGPHAALTIDPTRHYGRRMREAAE